MSIRYSIQRSIEMLDGRDRRLIWLAIFAQSLLALLDLVGVLLLALVGALGMSIVSAQPMPVFVESATQLLHLDGRESINILIVLAGAAALLLVIKSLVSAYLIRRVLTFLASRQALVALKLTKKLLSQPLLEVTRTSSQETAYALTTGVTAATVLLLGAAVVAAGEASLLIVLGGALLILDPFTAVGAVLYFAVVAIVLQRLLGRRSERIGSIAGAIDIASIQAVQEAVGMYREITVLNRRNYFIEKIGDLRWRAAELAADNQFISQIPKYIFEVALVFGGTLLALVLFWAKDSVGAISYLVLFLAAATRIMPSLMRLQGSAIQIRTGAGIARPTYALDDQLKAAQQQDFKIIEGTSFVTPHSLDENPPLFNPKVSIVDVSFTYPGKSDWRLEHVNLEFESGSSVALIGPSGSGKSTVADLILGIITPDSGKVLLSGEPSRDAIRRWSGRIAYVPQHVFEASGTIRDNVALGIPEQLIDDDRVLEALKQAQLLQPLKDSNIDLDTEVGEQGIRLSGGQRQRLGLARAFYSSPQLLVLDEATSALDAETENLISDTLESLRGRVTTITIAHRLATIRKADLVVYIEGGRVIGAGTFDEVRAGVPQLNRNANILGL